MPETKSVTNNTCDIVGIGNAIVDVISRESDSFLAGQDLVKGSMLLIDADRAVELYEAMSVMTEASGGSAGNTMAGVASFGASAAFIGKVADDHLGQVFADDITQNGVHFGVARAAEAEPTGRSMIIVTPDAERTMNTYLGAATTLYRADVDEALVGAAKVVYCEGYIWDVDVTKDAIRHAIACAKQGGARISFTLSDSFCVERHFDEWHELIDSSIDVLFGNEAELATLTGMDTFEASVEAVRGRCEILCATRGAEGSLIVTADETIEVAAVPVESVVDTTGAGDQYAAGFLYGLTAGKSLAESGRLGSAAAAQIISHMGARPTQPFAALI